MNCIIQRILKNYGKEFEEFFYFIDTEWWLQCIIASCYVLPRLNIYFTNVTNECKMNHTR